MSSLDFKKETADASCSYEGFSYDVDGTSLNLGISDASLGVDDGFESVLTLLMSSCCYFERRYYYDFLEFL